MRTNSAAYLAAGCLTLSLGLLAFAQPTRDPRNLQPRLEQPRAPKPAEETPGRTTNPGPSGGPTGQPQAVPAEPFTTKVEISGITGENYAPAILTPLRTSMEVVEYAEGGQRALKYRPGAQRSDLFVLAGPITDPNCDALRQWYKNFEDGLFDRRSASVIFYRADQQEFLRYNIFEIWPRSFSIDPASGTYTVEIVFEKLERA